MQDELFSIGVLSKVSKISVDTIRYYDSIGLLTPAYVCSESKYRYYNESQAEILAKILEWKSYGCSLSEIKILVNDPISTDSILRRRYLILREEFVRIQNVLNKLEQKINSEVQNEKKNFVD